MPIRPHSQWLSLDLPEGQRFAKCGDSCAMAPAGLKRKATAAPSATPPPPTRRSGVPRPRTTAKAKAPDASARKGGKKGAASGSGTQRRGSTSCTVCGASFAEGYLESLDTPTELCKDHGEFHRSYFAYLSESDFSSKYRDEEDETFQDLVQSAAAVVRGTQATTALPAQVTESEVVKLSASKKFGAWTRSEFFQRWKLMPEQLQIRPWDLIDEWGAPFKGVLTEELEGAPRVIKISAAKHRSMEEFKLLPNNTVHAAQASTCFTSCKADLSENMKELGSKRRHIHRHRRPYPKEEGAARRRRGRGRRQRICHDQGQAADPKRVPLLGRCAAPHRQGVGKLADRDPSAAGSGADRRGWRHKEQCRGRPEV